MPLLACGINHKTAPISIREKVVFPHEQMPGPLLNLIEKTQIGEAAILSTCHRTEIYCDAQDPQQIIRWLQAHQQIATTDLTPHIYVHREQAAVRHILRVASGLDSMVVGETQILGQVKAAVSLAKKAGTLGQQLRRLFQYVFSSAKQVRTQTAIGSHPVSLAFAAVDLAKHIFADISQVSVLLIGAGETINLAARHLQAAGVTRFAVANRSLTPAVELAKVLGGRSLELSQIATYLPEADIVIAATASPVPILGKGAVERALKIRKRRVIFMADLAMPRDIEPEVANLEDVYLYSLDDLHSIISKNLQHREHAAHEAESIIDLQTHRYMQTLKIVEATPLIRAYRAQAESARDDELAKAKRLLQLGISPEEVLNRLANNLTNKLLHAPSIQLRKAAASDQNELLLQLQKLFEV